MVPRSQLCLGTQGRAQTGMRTYEGSQEGMTDDLLGTVAERTGFSRVRCEVALREILSRGLRKMDAVFGGGRRRAHWSKVQKLRDRIEATSTEELLKNEN